MGRDALSITRKITGAINKKSKIQESKIRAAVGLATKKIIHDYPEYHFDFSSSLQLKSIRERISSTFPNAKLGDTEKQNLKIQPDGGLLFILDEKKNRHLVLACEAKRQGMNDVREANGEDKKQVGNAIERFATNANAIKSYMSNEPIVPYLMYCQGCDFDDSSTLGRLLRANDFASLNTIHLYKDYSKYHTRSLISIFARVEEWTVEEMAPTMVEMMVGSIDHYVSRYGHDFFLKK